MEFTGTRLGLASGRFIETRTPQLIATGLSIRSQKAMLHSRNMAFLCAAVLTSTLAARPQAVLPSPSTDANHPEILFVQAAYVKGGRL